MNLESSHSAGISGVTGQKITTESESEFESTSILMSVNVDDDDDDEDDPTISLSTVASNQLPSHSRQTSIAESFARIKSFSGKTFAV